MEQEQHTTEYDELVQTRELQMLKSMIPFMNINSQLPIAMLIQSIEFRNTLRIFQNNANALTTCSIKNEPEKRNAMLTTIRQFCTPKERETIDNILNIMCIMENYDAFSS